MNPLTPSQQSTDRTQGQRFSAPTRYEPREISETEIAGLVHGISLLMAPLFSGIEIYTEEELKELRKEREIKRLNEMKEPKKGLLRVAIICIALGCLGYILKNSEKNTPYSPALD